MKSCKLEKVIQANDVRGSERKLARLHGFAIVSAMILLLSTGRALAADFKLWRVDKSGVVESLTDKETSWSKSVVGKNADIQKFIEEKKLFNEPAKLIEVFASALSTAKGPERVALVKQLQSADLLKKSKSVTSAKAAVIREILAQLAGLKKEDLSKSSDELLKLLLGDEETKAIRQAAFEVTDVDPAQASELDAATKKKLEDAEKKAADAEKARKEFEEKNGKIVGEVKTLTDSLKEKIKELEAKGDGVQTPPVADRPVGEQNPIGLDQQIAPICDQKAEIDALKQAQADNRVAQENNLKSILDLFARTATLKAQENNARNNNNDDADQKIIDDALRAAKFEQPLQQQPPLDNQFQQQPLASNNAAAPAAAIPAPEATPRNEEQPQQPPMVPPPSGGFYGPLPEIKPDINAIDSGTTVLNAARGKVDQADLALLANPVPTVVNPMTGGPTQNPFVMATTLGNQKAKIAAARTDLAASNKALQAKIDYMDKAIREAKAAPLADADETYQGLQQELTRAKREADDIEARANMGDQSAMSQVYAMRQRATEADRRAQDYQKNMSPAKKKALAEIRSKEEDKAKLEAQKTENDAKIVILQQRETEFQSALDQNTQLTTSMYSQGANQQSQRPNAFGASGGGMPQGMANPQMPMSRPQTLGVGGVGRSRFGR